jgi:hypothetical protein
MRGSAGRRKGEGEMEETMMACSQQAHLEGGRDGSRLAAMTGKGVAQVATGKRQVSFGEDDEWAPQKF